MLPDEHDVGEKPNTAKEDPRGRSNCPAAPRRRLPEPRRPIRKSAGSGQGRRNALWDHLDDRLPGEQRSSPRLTRAAAGRRNAWTVSASHCRGQGSNPLSSTRTSARTALGSRRPRSLDYLINALARKLMRRTIACGPVPGACSRFARRASSSALICSHPG